MAPDLNRVRAARQMLLREVGHPMAQTTDERSRRELSGTLFRPLGHPMGQTTDERSRREPSGTLLRPLGHPMAQAATVEALRLRTRDG